MGQPIVITDIDARVKDTGDTMTGTLYIDAELGLITGSETQTSYSGMQATRLCASDDNNVNTAGFIINSTGESKFLHRRGPRTAGEDAYFQFDGEGLSFYANGTKGGTPVNSTPVFQALQTATAPTFNGTEISLLGHGHTALIDITELWFKCHANDFAAIKTTIEDTNTYFDFYLGDDPSQQDVWRWRFKPSGADEYTAMLLDPISATETKLYIYGRGIEISGSSVDNGYTVNAPYIYIHNNTYGGTAMLGADKESAYLQLQRNNGTIACHIDVLNSYPRLVVYNDEGTVIFNRGFNEFSLNGHTHSNYLPLSGSTMTGEITFAQIATWPTPSDETYPIESKGITWSGSSDTARIFYRVSASDTGNLVLRTGDDANCSIIFENSAKGQLGKVSQTGIYGAVWNDYAEFRDQEEEIPFGYCAASADDGRLSKTTRHLQACDGIVSDTYGFAIGETENCRTPLAVAGRVLAYCEGDRYDYHAGDTVGASANGKVIKMTREEIKEYPDRIIGHVSEIPEYETWGSGNVPVNGRIWIKVK